MKKTILTLGLITLLTSLSISCNKKIEETPAAAVVDKEQIKMEIQEIENKFSEFYNSNTPDSISHYAADAKCFFIKKQPLSGKEAIINYLKEDMANLEKGSKMSFTTNEVYVSNDGINVTAIGAFKMVDSTNTKVYSGNYFSVFEKTNGKYLCKRLIAAPDVD